MIELENLFAMRDAYNFKREPFDAARFELAPARSDSIFLHYDVLSVDRTDLAGL